MKKIVVHSEVVGPLGVWRAGSVVEDCPDELATGLIELGRASELSDKVEETKELPPEKETSETPKAPEGKASDEDEKPVDDDEG